MHEVEPGVRCVLVETERELELPVLDAYDVELLISHEDIAPRLGVIADLALDLESEPAADVAFDASPDTR